MSEHESGSGFSFLLETQEGGTGAFGGIEAADGAETGFSFLNEEISTKRDDEPVSAFSFLQSHESSDNQPDHVEEPHSSNTPEQVAEAGEAGAGSGFSFIGGEGRSSFTFMESEDAHRLEHAAVQTAAASMNHLETQEIKLEKVASARNVKKKKRGTKVGYGRDEDPGEEEHPPDPPERRTSTKHVHDTSAETNLGVVPGPHAEIPVVDERPNRESVPSPLHSKIISAVGRTSGIIEDSKASSAAAPELPAGPDTPPKKNSTPTASETKSVSLPSSAAGTSPVAPATPEAASVAFVHTKKYSLFDIFRRGGSDEQAGASKGPSVAAPMTLPIEQHRNQVTKVDSSITPSVHTPVPVTKTNTERQTLSPGGQDGSDMFSGMSTAQLPQTSSMPGATRKVSAEPVVALPSSVGAPKDHRPPPSLVAASPVEKKKEDVCETLTKLGEEITDQIIDLMDKMSTERQNLLNTITSGINEISEIEVNIQNSKRKMRELEAEQLRLGEQEDFEAAAALSDLLEALRTRVMGLQERIRDLTSDVQQAQRVIRTSHTASSQKLQHTARGLGNIRRQKDEEWNKKAKEWEQQYSSEDIAVKAEEERIELEMTHVLREEESLNEEGAVIEAQISSQTEVLTGTKTSLESRLNSTLSEIAELELALAAKRADEIDIRDDLKKVDSSISEVRRKYERQLQRIYDRRTAAVAAQSECANEVLQIKKERELLEASLLQFEKSKSENESWFEITGVEIKAVEEFSSTMAASTDLESMGIADNVPSKNTEELDSLTAALQDAETALASSCEALALEQIKASQLTDENHDISEKLPLMEVDKKNHATMKRFKEAAAVSKDIKALSTRRDEIEQELGALVGSIERCRDTIRVSEEAVSNAKNKLRDAQKISDMQRFNMLLKRAVLLNKSKLRLSQPYFSIDKKVVPMAVKLIDIELKAALSEAGELKEKHGLSQNLDESSLFAAPENDTQHSDMDLADTGMQKMGDIGHETDESINDNGPNSLVEIERKSENGNEVTPTDAQELKTQDFREDLDGPSEEEQRRRTLSFVKRAHQELGDIEKFLQDAVDSEDYDEAASCSEKIECLRAQINEHLENLGMTLENALAANNYVGE